jgi:hypothetical protein
MGPGVRQDDGKTHFRPLAALIVRGFQTCPSKKREQGMPGARCTRGLVCKIVRKGAHEHTGSAESIRHPPRNGFTAYAVISSATNSFCHRRCRLDGWSIRLDRCHHRQVGASNGRRDHTVLPYASASFVCALLTAHGNPPCDNATRRRCRVHRILSRVRDDVRPPLLPGKDGRISGPDLRDGSRGIFSIAGLDRFY